MSRAVDAPASAGRPRHEVAVGNEDRCPVGAGRQLLLPRRVRSSGGLWIADRLPGLESHLRVKHKPLDAPLAHEEAS